jgi:hypothetical protein
MEQNTTVDLINKLKEVIIPLADKLKMEATDLYTIRNDARNLESRNRELKIINEQLIKQNETIIEEGKDIIKSARVEAD